MKHPSFIIIPYFQQFFGLNPVALLKSERWRLVATPRFCALCANRRRTRVRTNATKDRHKQPHAVLTY